MKDENFPQNHGAKNLLKFGIWRNDRRGTEEARQEWNLWGNTNVKSEAGAGEGRRAGDRLGRSGSFALDGHGRRSRRMLVGQAFEAGGIERVTGMRGNPH